MFAIKAVAACLLLSTPVSAGAWQAGADEAERSRHGKHRIELGVGLFSEIGSSTEISASGVKTESDANGLLGFLGYTYYFERDWGFTISIGALNADASTEIGVSGVNAESAVVTPLLFGVKYQPAKLTMGKNLMPYASGAIGPYFGYASNVRVGTTTAAESVSETAFGLRLGIGLDLFLGRYFVFGIGLGYNLVTEFDNRIGADRDYSSPDFSLSLGVTFGR